MVVESADVQVLSLRFSEVDLSVLCLSRKALNKQSLLRVGQDYLKLCQHFHEFSQGYLALVVVLGGFLKHFDESIPLFRHDRKNFVEDLL